MSDAALVFLIDDDLPLLRALSRRLLLAGYDTESFSAPADFLARKPYKGPGCIVLDLMMPQMNGLEFHKALRARGVHLPVIFLSGHGNVPAASAAFKGGAVDFLTKPVRSEELIAAISDALARYQTALAEVGKAGSVRMRYSQLTPREREVCGLIVQGLLNKQIGYSLGAAEATIKKHRARVLEKLGVQSVAELVTAVELMKRHSPEGSRPTPLPSPVG
jgi:FixJ family two-component response regulator